MGYRANTRTVAALGLLPLGNAIAIRGLEGILGRRLRRMTHSVCCGRRTRIRRRWVQEEGGRGNGDGLSHIPYSAVAGVLCAVASAKRRRRSRERFPSSALARGRLCVAAEAVDMCANLGTLQSFTGHGG